MVIYIIIIILLILFYGYMKNKQDNFVNNKYSITNLNSKLLDKVINKQHILNYKLLNTNCKKNREKINNNYLRDVSELMFRKYNIGDTIYEATSIKTNK